MTPTQRKAMEQALMWIDAQPWPRMIGATTTLHALRAALAEQPAEQVPFQPDWVNYRQGLRDGWTEGYEQGIADERTSEANIGIAWFDAKVHPARVNPYESTAPQPAKREPLLVRDLAELIGSTVPDVCKALEDLGIKPRRSTNAAVTPDEALAVARQIAQPAKRVPLTREHVRGAGGIVHSDGNVFFTSLDQLNSAIEAAHGIKGETK